MTADFLVKGILIGLLFGIPVGAVGALTVQRTCCHGFGAGLKTGLGSFVADCLCLYAACGRCFYKSFLEIGKSFIRGWI